MNSATVPEPLSLKRNTLFNTVGSVLYQGCLWLTTVLVVIFSNSFYDSGVLAFAMAVSNLFNPIATYSMRIFQVSDVDDKYSRSNYVAFRLVTIAAGFAFIIPYTVIVAADAPTAIATLVFMLFKADEAFCDVLYGIDQRGMRMDYIGISQFVRGVLVAALFAGALLANLGLTAAMAAMFVSCFCVTLFYDIPHARRFGQMKPAISVKIVGRLLLECLPVVIATMLLGMVVSIPRQYYGIACGFEPLGIYAAIATPAVLIQACARYFYSPALVPLALKYSENEEKGEFNGFFLRMALILVACAVAMVVLLSIIGAPCLVLVYGEKVAAYTYLFPYVLVGTGLIAIVWYLTDTLVILRDMKGLVATNAVAAAVSVASMVPLIGAFDMNGINFVIILANACAIVVALARVKIVSSRPKSA